MEIDVVTTTDRSLLSGVRSVLETADEALMCVAFAHPRGVHLIEKELEAVAKRGDARMLVTTTFDQTGGSALSLAVGVGVKVSTLNPGSGSTYHPKVYLGRTGKKLSAIVGSANLTGGLAMNVEAGVWLRGTTSDTQLSQLWDWAESMWEDPRSEPWLAPAGDVVSEDELEPFLLAGIEQARRRDPVFRTLGANPARNLVTEVNPSGVFVETEKSKAERRPPQLVPAWMFNLAWDVLRARGELTNKELLTELRVHRSSAVCAILARLPGIDVPPGRGVALRLTT